MSAMHAVDGMPMHGLLCMWWLSSVHKSMRDGHSHGDAGGKSTPMDKDASARIQSAEAKKGGGGVEKGGFASRAQVGAVPIH